MDCGTYTVKISNSLSEVKADFVLTIKDKPQPPQGPAGVEWKNDDTMVLRWKPSKSDGGSPITEYFVERREVGKKSWKQVGTTAHNNTNLEIKGLKKGCSFNFRISARNRYVHIYIPNIIRIIYFTFPFIFNTHQCWSQSAINFGRDSDHQVQS